MELPSYHFRLDAGDVFRLLGIIWITYTMSAQPNDFDFILGNWTIHNRYLKERLKGSTEWQEFDARGQVEPILGGLGNVDRYTAVRNGKRVEGFTLRLFNPATGEWSLYWADDVRAGVLQPPMVGKFQDGVGEFFGDEEVNGRKVLCRFRWSIPTPEAPRWEQSFSTDEGKTWELNWVMDFTREYRRFDVVELRRYTIREGRRDDFVSHFEAYFPQAMRQLGAAVFGQFRERDHPATFTWFRGFYDMPARAQANQGLYGGPVWKEHRETMNGLLTDSDNVLLLRPLRPDSGLALLPAVDPVKEPDGAHGIVVAQIFAVKWGRVEEFARQAEVAFARYRGEGLRETGVLVTLDEPNNFPQLPVRTDGPYLVWFGIVRDDDGLARLRGLAAGAMFGKELQRREPEFLVLDPTPGSRMRWR